MAENQILLPSEDLKDASSQALAEAIIALLLEKKGRNLTAYFVGEESAITDYYINITATSSTAVLALARGYVPIAILMFLAASLRATMNALINGSGNSAVNFLTAILDGIVLRIGLSLLFGVALGMEYTGFWLGDAIAGFTPFVIGVLFYFFGGWQKKGLHRL